MKQNQRLRIVSSLLLLFFCVALSAHAAEEGGNAATEHANEIFKWINFAIVAGLLVWLFAKKLPTVFPAKRRKISSAITKATAARAEAERQLREAETKLANLQKEVAALGPQRNAKLPKKANASAPRRRATRQKVGVAAKAEIEAAERAARLELKALAATLAVDGAEIASRQAAHSAAQETLVGFVCEEPRGEAELKSASLQYANALADVALAQGAADPAAKQLDDFGTAYGGLPSCGHFLASPAVPRRREARGHRKNRGAHRREQNHSQFSFCHRGSPSHAHPSGNRRCFSGGGPAAAGNCRGGDFFRGGVERGAKKDALRKRWSGLPARKSRQSIRSIRRCWAARLCAWGHDLRRLVAQSA